MGQTGRYRTKKQQGGNCQWQDKMAEVKEAFRRIAHVKPTGASLRNETRSAPALSRNRRARIRSQVASKSLVVPPKVLDEMQKNRSQSPFVSFNHLQNVLGMCRRIQSQSSITERRKNPYDSHLYPVFVRRPASVNLFLDQNLDIWQNESPLSSSRPNSDRTPLTYGTSAFKPLYDISNGKISGANLSKRFYSGVIAGKKPHQKPSWIHYKKVVDHPRSGRKVNAAEKINMSAEKNCNLSVSDNSWRSSSSVAMNDSLSSFGVRKKAGSNRRAHSESDLNLHSSSSFSNGRMPGDLTNRSNISDCCSWNSLSTTTDHDPTRDAGKGQVNNSLGVLPEGPSGTIFTISPMRTLSEISNGAEEQIKPSNSEQNATQDSSCYSKPRVKFAEPANDCSSSAEQESEILSWDSSITWITTRSTKNKSPTGSALSTVDNFPPKPIHFLI